MRKDMRKLTDVNWSAVVREAMEERVRIEELRTKRHWDRVRQAVKMTDLIYDQMSRK